MRLIAATATATATASSLVAAKLIGLISTFTLGHPCCCSRSCRSFRSCHALVLSQVLATPCPVSVEFEKFALLYASPDTSLALVAVAMAVAPAGTFLLFPLPLLLPSTLLVYFLSFSILTESFQQEAYQFIVAFFWGGALRKFSNFPLKQKNEAIRSSSAKNRLNVRFLECGISKFCGFWIKFTIKRETNRARTMSKRFVSLLKKSDFSVQTSYNLNLMLRRMGYFSPAH